MDLSQKKCVPCEGGVSPLSQEQAQEYLKEVSNWELLENNAIRRRFTFNDFKEAMEFVNNVAGIAEAEGHHPDIKIFYNKVTLELWTHAADGLTENDFILAAKIDGIKI